MLGVDANNLLKQAVDLIGIEVETRHAVCVGGAAGGVRLDLEAGLGSERERDVNRAVVLHNRLDIKLTAVAELRAENHAERVLGSRVVLDERQAVEDI